MIIFSDMLELAFFDTVKGQSVNFMIFHAESKWCENQIVHKEIYARKFKLCKRMHLIQHAKLNRIQHKLFYLMWLSSIYSKPCWKASHILQEWCIVPSMKNVMWTRPHSTSH